MQVKTEQLRDRVQSGKSIYRSAKYFKDLALHLDDSLADFFNYVKNIPYEEDREFELVARPKFLLNDFKTLDCKKKAVLIGAWLEAHRIPWRLVGVSERPDKLIHHVFVQAKIKKHWANIDATYPEYRLFEGKPEVTAGEVLPR